MGAVCSGKRPKTSDIEDTDAPPPLQSNSRVSPAIDIQAIEVDDARSNFVQVEDKTSTDVVPIAGERTNKLPDKYPEEQEKKKPKEKIIITEVQKKIPESLEKPIEKKRQEIPKTKPLPAPITTVVEADPAQIQIEDTVIRKRTPVSSSPKQFAEDLKADLEGTTKKRGPESRERPPEIDIPTVYKTGEPLIVANEAEEISKPLSSRSDLSEVSSLGEMFAADLKEDKVVVEEARNVDASEKETDEVETPNAEKLADLFADLGDSNTDILFAEENEAKDEVPLDTIQEEEEEEVEAKEEPDVTEVPEADAVKVKQSDAVEVIEEFVEVQDVAEVETDIVEVKEVNVEVPETAEVVKIPETAEVVKVEVENVKADATIEKIDAPEPIVEPVKELEPVVVATHTVISEDDDVMEFEEPESTEVATPVKAANENEKEAITIVETKEDVSGLHAVDEIEYPESPEEKYVEPPPILDSMELEVSDPDTSEKKSDDFVNIQPNSALEDMAEPIVLPNPIDHVEEVRDEVREPSPEMKLFLVSEDGRESVRLNPSEINSLQTFVKEDYSLGLGEVEETDRERDIEINHSPRQYHEEYMRDGKWTVKRQSCADRALAQVNELEDVRRQMRASRSLEKFTDITTSTSLEKVESLETLDVTTPRERSLSPRRSRSKSPLIQRLSAKFEKPTAI